MLGQRLWRWANIKLILGERLVFAGSALQAYSEYKAKKQYLLTLQKQIILPFGFAWLYS